MQIKKENLSPTTGLFQTDKRIFHPMPCQVDYITQNSLVDKVMHLSPVFTLSINYVDACI